MGRPRRPRPPDFSAAYIQHGEALMPEIFRCGMRAVRRWRGEVGSEALRQARREFVANQREARRRAKQHSPKLNRGVASWL